MSRGGYRILDEPAPGPHEHLAVNPFWPLLGLMLGGAWLGFPWFVVNGVAMGSASRRREWLVAGGAVLGTALAFGLLVMVFRDVPSALLAYAPIPFVLVKLGAGYWLYALQSSSFDLFEYFGGKAKNGLPVVIAGAFLAPKLLGALPDWLGVFLR